MKKRKTFTTIVEMENWINAIQSQGYQLVAFNEFFGSYTFEPRTDEFIPTVRIDYRPYLPKEDYADYITLFTDNGWKLLYVSSDDFYFFQQTPEATDTVIFSDDDSKEALAKRQYKRTMTSFWTLLSFTLFWLANTLNSPQGFWGFLNIKSLYLTPSLWDMTGIRFWFSFLFESLFVLTFRTPFLFFLMLGSAVYYLYSAQKQKKQFEN